jgi:hypothetical protein
MRLSYSAILKKSAVHRVADFFVYFSHIVNEWDFSIFTTSKPGNKPGCSKSKYSGFAKDSPKPNATT